MQRDFPDWCASVRRSYFRSTRCCSCISPIRQAYRLQKTPLFQNGCRRNVIRPYAHNDAPSRHSAEHLLLGGHVKELSLSQAATCYQNVTNRGKQAFVCSGTESIAHSDTCRISSTRLHGRREDTTFTEALRQTESAASQARSRNMRRAASVLFPTRQGKLRPQHNDVLVGDDR